MVLITPLILMSDEVVEDKVNEGAMPTEKDVFSSKAEEQPIPRKAVEHYRRCKKSNPRRLKSQLNHPLKSLRNQEGLWMLTNLLKDLKRVDWK
ncbi:hypothetical protein Dsin_000882 [Dipteronia sinensis]|uniref:Uncharacterized protein n=1 Tax=Dipteronia sinensis TaxID=43782 RepID=A0AAE0B2S7_9ROSI|nr:hypothetical protein Dsin_000882 [Dipteronia sinensis]